MAQRKVWGVLATFLVLGASVSLAQTSKECDDLRRAIDALTESHKALQQDIQEMKNLLRARPTPAPAGDEDLHNVTLISTTPA